jgi:hypothetical protein
MIVVGIDPGAGGGMAVLVGGTLTSFGKMPATEGDLLLWFQDLRKNAGETLIYACIEKVGGYTGQGQPGSAMFNFGWGYGSVRMAAMAVGCSLEEVTPRTWQKQFGIVPRGKDEKKSVFKNRLKAKAQQLVPGAPLTLATCDALLIAIYHQRQLMGKLQ